MAGKIFSLPEMATRRLITKVIGSEGSMTKESVVKTQILFAEEMERLAREIRVEKGIAKTVKADHVRNAVYHSKRML